MLTGGAVRNEREVCADHDGPRDGPCRRCGHLYARHPQWIEDRLRELARYIDWPPTPDLSKTVIAQLQPRKVETGAD
jgi:hypothetical protein